MSRYLCAKGVLSHKAAPPQAMKVTPSQAQAPVRAQAQEARDQAALLVSSLLGVLLGGIFLRVLLSVLFGGFLLNFASSALWCAFICAFARLLPEHDQGAPVEHSAVLLALALVCVLAVGFETGIIMIK